MARGRGRVPSGTNVMYHRLAPQYDLQYARKDYRGEVRRLTAYVHQYGRSGGRRWLDVACGTGRHLDILRRSFEVAGVDGSAEMLRIARERVPGVPLLHADMRSFRMPGRYDAISCLFSAVGNLPGARALATTYRNFARHLAPGGLLIVEPWIDPAKFRPGSVHLLAVEGPDQWLARMAYSRRRGDRSVIEYRFLLGTPHRGIETLVETDIGFLAAPALHRRLLLAAGLRPRFVRPKEFLGRRGLWIATKPLA